MSEDLLGPFTITPTQVSSLGSAFTPFVNQLLRAEVAAAGLSGSQITTTYQENIGDEGVDGGISRGVETRTIPAGDSAWQFKRGDLPPAKCKKELKGATAALEILRNGGKYRLVLGADINFAQMNSRRKALREQAEALGIPLQDDSIKVLNASDLAKWAEQHPSLTISHLLGGFRRDVEDFDEWAGSAGATTSWVESDARRAFAAEVRKTIEEAGRPPLHIEGVSGLGKSRTVLEALRGQPYASQVVYVRAADRFPPQLIRHLAGEGRTAILIVDECDPSQHKVLAETIPVGSRLRLVTIGEPGPSRSEGPSLSLPKMEQDKLVEILQANRPGLWHEAVYFVADMSDGNVRLALVLGEAVEKEPRLTAARLITRDIISTFVAEALPEGTSFLACCGPALFTRLRIGGEQGSELPLLAEMLQIDENELRASQRALRDLDLVTTKGQYLGVAPHPLAVYLAARAWEDFGDRIVESLLPQLEPDLLRRLLERAVEVGPTSSINRAIDTLLADSERFGSLGALATGNSAIDLILLADINPHKVGEVLYGLITEAADDELDERQSLRQHLVWTLEKLVWHSETFESAADLLLRLAATEGDGITQTATRPWLAIFGPNLPGTAATPQQRLAYLSRHSSIGNILTRKLIVRAGAAMLQVRESIFGPAAGPIGVPREPRGGPATYGGVWEYQRGGIELLRHLVDDDDPGVASAALEVLVSAIHLHLERVGKVARRVGVTDVTGVASMVAWRKANSIHPISPMRSGR